MDRDEFISRLDNVDSHLSEDRLNRVLSNALRCGLPEYVGSYNLVIVMEEISELLYELSNSILGNSDITGLIEELADNTIGVRCIITVCSLSMNNINNFINKANVGNLSIIRCINILSEVSKYISKYLRYGDSVSDSCFEEYIAKYILVIGYISRKFSISQIVIDKAINVKLDRLENLGKNFA